MSNSQTPKEMLLQELEKNGEDIDKVRCRFMPRAVGGAQVNMGFCSFEDLEDDPGNSISCYGEKASYYYKKYPADPKNPHVTVKMASSYLPWSV